MLLLTRKPGESLVIEIAGMSEPIEITLMESGAQARIGISAPTQCRIWRKELYQTVLTNRLAAEQTGQTAVRTLAKGLALELHPQKEPVTQDGQKRTEASE